MICQLMYFQQVCYISSYCNVKWRFSLQECLYWTECCLHESLNNYRNASDEDERQDCAIVIVNTLNGIMNLIEKQGFEICMYIIYNLM